MRRNMRICGGSGASKERPRIDDAASQHGLELLRNGFPVEEIVYGYGDLCQAITDLAVERNATIQTHEFRTVNHCLDTAIADALISYSARPHTPLPADNPGQYERLGFLAHELRNHLQTAGLAIAAIRAGNAGAAGATAAVLDRSMTGMRDLVDRSLTDVRAAAQLPARLRMINLADFIAEIRPSASLRASAIVFCSPSRTTAADCRRVTWNNCFGPSRKSATTNPVLDWACRSAGAALTPAAAF